jgi:hypothetical protein
MLVVILESKSEDCWLVGLLLTLFGLFKIDVRNSVMDRSSGLMCSQRRGSYVTKKALELLSHSDWELECQQLIAKRLDDPD